MKPSDVQLVERALQGDKTAFGLLVERYQEMVWQTAMRWVQNPVEAQDIAQEAFLKAYEYLESLKRKEKFGPWLKRITVNLCKRWFERQGKFIYLEEMEGEEIEAILSTGGAPGPDEPCERREIVNAVMRAG